MRLNYLWIEHVFLGYYGILYHWTDYLGTVYCFLVPDILLSFKIEKNYTHQSESEYKSQTVIFNSNYYNESLSIPLFSSNLSFHINIPHIHFLQRIHIPFISIIKKKLFYFHPIHRQCHIQSRADRRVLLFTSLVQVDREGLIRGHGGQRGRWIDTAAAVSAWIFDTPFYPWLQKLLSCTSSMFFHVGIATL